MPELIAYVDGQTISVGGTWDLYPYFVTGYLLNNNDLVGPEIGSPLTRVFPPNAVSGTASWHVRYDAGGLSETIVADGNVDEGTGTLVWPGYFVLPAFFTDYALKSFNLIGDIYCMLEITYWPAAPICWTLTYTGPDGKIDIKRGPGRPPSKFIIPQGSDLSTVKLIEDGLLIPSKRYQIITEG